MSKERVWASKLADLNEDTRVFVVSGDIEIGIVRSGEMIRAFSNVCPHQGGPVCEGILIGRVEAVLGHQGEDRGRTFSESLHLVCPWHGWEYDLETGRCAARGDIWLEQFGVEVEGDDVYVVLQTRMPRP